MTTKTLLHQATLKEWAARFTDQKASGLNVADWCSRNGVTRDSFFYWKRKLKNELITQVLPDIVPLALPEPDVPECSSNPMSCYGSVASSTSCTTCTTGTIGSSAKIRIGDVTIELDDSASEGFITNIIKAVSHA